MEYNPTVFDSYNVNVMVDGRTVGLTIWDTAGQDDYNALRPLSYPQTNVFILCYSVTNQESLDHVAGYRRYGEGWEVELKHHCPGVPIILAGLKADLLDDAQSQSKIVPFTKALEVGFQIGAVKTMEVSSLTGRNVKILFDEAIRAAMAPKKSSRSSERDPLTGGSSTDDGCQCVLL